jgi:hypothetical protein
MMRTLALIVTLAAVSALVLTSTSAQPGGQPKNPDTKDDPSGLVARMMAFDKNGDGKLTKEELTDVRLHRLFDRADVNKRGFVTREDLLALAAQMARDEPAGKGGQGGKDGFGKDGFGKGPGGKGGPGGFGRPQPGVVLPTSLQEQLKLSDDQKKQVAALQADVDTRLGKILTDEQKTMLKEMRERGPGGPGGPPGKQ